jgi:hypothetical protein
MKSHFEQMKTAGNVVLHVLLGAGIACLFLPWEKHFFLQMIICGPGVFFVAMFLEAAQEFFLKAKGNKYDAVNCSLGGMLVYFIYISIYGAKLDMDIDFNQPPRMIWFYIGLVLIVSSGSYWVYKNFLKKKGKENS